MAEDGVEDTEPQGGVGAQLRAARETRGLTLEQLAAETRIPQRHLVTIEAGEFAALPARTYAIGFTRTYAKAVGLNDNDVTELVRAELDAQEPPARGRPAGFEPGDPARVPSNKVVWLVVFGLLILVAGIFFAFRTMFAPAAELPSLIEQEQTEQAAQAQQQRAVARPGTAAAAAAGPVVFTALEDGIWVKFYDASGAQLMQKLMARGERYTVPPEAEGPQLWTGRPDALAITVGGRAIAKLADDDMIVRDVPVTAEALLARSRQTPTPRASPTA